MTEPIAQRQDFHRIQEWLFAISRFAITLQQTDRVAALTITADMDRGESVSHGSGLTFFVRTTIKLCDAIAAKDDPDAIATLRAYLRQIEHLPLRRAFEAALDLDLIPTKRHKPFNRSRDYLWKGLPTRVVTHGGSVLNPDSSPE